MASQKYMYAYKCVYMCVCRRSFAHVRTESMHYPYAVGQRYLCGNENGESHVGRRDIREKRSVKIIKSACHFARTGHKGARFR